ncbi:MAG: sugar ABC transporter permease, partial [Planctomycetes bacterium]|nr:sugar ABC transporter permease [Planctomycetota bacterium]
MEKKSLSTTRKRRHWAPYGFLLPSIVTILVVILVPTILAIYTSLNDVNLTTDGGRYHFVGLSNFFNLFSDPRFYNSLRVTGLYVSGCVILETLFGLAIALFLNRRFTGKSVFRTMMIMPMFVTPVVAALSWRMFYDPTSGMINYFLGAFGFGNKLVWLGDPVLALPSVIITDLWQSTPFMILVILAGLNALPTEIYEVAHSDGASELQCIRHITLPLMVPTILVAVFFRVIDALKSFDLIWVMTRG